MNKVLKYLIICLLGIVLTTILLLQPNQSKGADSNPSQSPTPNGARFTAPTGLPKDACPVRDEAVPSGTTKDDNQDSSVKLPDYQVITMSLGEKIYYRKGLVEKIEVDGFIANPSMPLEFIACAEGGKDYESLVVLKCKPWNIHLALILSGLKEGKGPQSFGDPTKPTGDFVLAFVSWEKVPSAPAQETPHRDPEVKPSQSAPFGDGKTVSYRIEDLIIDSQTQKPLELVGWSFSGSMFADEIDYDTGKPTGKKIYLADIEKNIIANWHDPAAILNIPTQGGLYLSNKQLLPPRGTKITMTMRPPNTKELEELKKINSIVAEREQKDKQEKQQKQPPK